MFWASFAWSFVFVSLPFHIQAISTIDPVATLRWAGWILGVSSLVTVVTAPLWGRLAGRADPKRYYVLVEIFQGAGFLGMAAARTLVELFLSRVALGFMGASSTFAFILAGRAADPAEVRRQVAAVQSAMTVGNLLGPLGGAIAATRLGFRPSFVVGALILLGCAVLVQLGVTMPNLPAAARKAEGRPGGRDVAIAAAIVLAGSTHLFFLTSVLPQILADLGVTPARGLEVGGVVVFVSAAGTALGAIGTPRLAALTSERRLVATLLATSSGLLALLGATRSVWTFTALRFLQALSVAPVFPLVVAGIAHRAGGGTIGLINSARIGAAFVGPLVATSILAVAPPAALYLTLAAAGVACAPLGLWRPRPAGSK
jgi:DHA1 family multidrug resistance protein-like MFS transporter